MKTKIHIRILIGETPVGYGRNVAMTSSNYPISSKVHPSEVCSVVQKIGHLLYFIKIPTPTSTSQNFPSISFSTVR